VSRDYCIHWKLVDKRLGAVLVESIGAMCTRVDVLKLFTRKVFGTSIVCVGETWIEAKPRATFPRCSVGRYGLRDPAAQFTIR